MINIIAPAIGTAIMDVSSLENRPQGVQIFSLTPTGALTINAVPDGLPNQEYEVRLISNGTAFAVTFGNNFVKSGTATTSATVGTVTKVGFTSTGSKLEESYRNTPSI